MKRILWLVVTLAAFAAADAHASPWPCECMGGMDPDISPTYWYLLDETGYPLEDDDWVYVAWKGPDGEKDPPQSTGPYCGAVTDDDVIIGEGTIASGGFFINVVTFAPEDGQHPWTGEEIYCRIFNGPKYPSCATGWYGDSDQHVVENFLVETFYAKFPGDPGGGCTDTPLSGSPPTSDLTWSSLLGGSASDYGYSIAVDGEGNAYVTGETWSSGFPTTTGAYDRTLSGERDAFVTKLNPTGSALVYSTFLGGDGEEAGRAIAVDGDGSAYMTGQTSAAGFPTTGGAYDQTYNGSWDVFVTKLNPTGSALGYSTYLGGSDTDYGYGIAVDGSHNAYTTGRTHSSSFPSTGGAYDQSHNGYEDVFVTKLNPTGSALDYSTFLGGSDSERGYGVAVDGDGDAYVTGYTSSWSDFPVTPGAFSTNYSGGNSDVFVARLNSTGSALDYSTFLGGSADYTDDKGYGIAVDGMYYVYVTGYTSAFDFPTTTGAYDQTYNGSHDVFVTKLNPGGSSLVYSTLLGGSYSEDGLGIAVDQLGYAHVTGWTGSSDFPTTSWAFDTTYNSVTDAFVTKLHCTGSGLSYSTFLGSSQEDEGHGIAVDGSRDAYVTGYTSSIYFPTTTDAFDRTYNGGNWDAFAAKLGTHTYLQCVPVVLVSFQATGGQGYIVLDWVTASEINCHRWEIYRSQREDNEYTKIKDLLGHGSTETTHTYTWVDRQVDPGVTYFYKLRQVDFDGSSTWSFATSATASSTMPKAYALAQNYPNPFNTNTEICYQISQNGHVSLKVFNILGQQICTLVDAEQKASRYAVNWDGRDDLSHPVASGLYFCRLRSGAFNKTVKMILLR